MSGACKISKILVKQGERQDYQSADEKTDKVPWGPRCWPWGATRLVVFLAPTDCFSSGGCLDPSYGCTKAGIVCTEGVGMLGVCPRQ